MSGSTNRREVLPHFPLVRQDVTYEAHGRRSAVDVQWEPTCPESALLALGDGRVVLGIRAHFDDLDRRTVVLLRVGAERSSMSADNAEGPAATSTHRTPLRLAGVLRQAPPCSDGQTAITQA